MVLLLTLSTKLHSEERPKGEPIVITSISLINDNRAKTATFDGNVVAKRGDITLYSNKLIVHYDNEQGNSTIKMIEAIGNVRLTKAKRVITSHRAVYYPEPEEKVIFTGEPRVSEGNNLVTGERITYYIKEDKALVEKSRVYLEDRKRAR